ncbi:MAG: hypothetical protein M3164_03695 [Actinomycetota bacterium]|nr:hypothetical protein [Actinomycetota bacterium]
MDEEEEQKIASMQETLSKVSGNKPLGPSDPRKKKEERILGFYADRPSLRNEQIMKDLENTVNEPPKSIGERIEKR